MTHPPGQLTINLAAIQHNWRLLKSTLAAGAECGAVVKADAYGLGIKQVAPKLAEAGCRSFFVATLAEAVELTPLVPPLSRIFVLCGCYPGEEELFITRGFIPVIISVPMFRRWHQVVKNSNSTAPIEAILKINTGMNRLGIETDEFNVLLENPEQLAEARITILMSHFACADEPGHPLNERQIERFSECMAKAKKVLPHVRGTLCNSSGIFLSPVAHFDLSRPGISLYGGNPQPQSANPMSPVVGLELTILQTRRLLAGESVGYGATNTASFERYIVTVAGGYADGIMRIMGNHGFGFFKNVRAPIVGRISMDTTVFDVTAMPADQRPEEGDKIELLGEHGCIDELADAVGTISYEILTSLGSRYKRTYIG